MLQDVVSNHSTGQNKIHLRPFHCSKISKQARVANHQSTRAQALCQLCGMLLFACYLWSKITELPSPRVEPPNRHRAKGGAPWPVAPNGPTALTWPDLVMVPTWPQHGLAEHAPPTPKMASTCLKPNMAHLRPQMGWTFISRISLKIILNLQCTPKRPPHEALTEIANTCVPNMSVTSCGFDSRLINPTLCASRAAKRACLCSQRCT